MRFIIQQYAGKAPKRMLWGSDWPHVNPGYKNLGAAPPLQVDTSRELELIRMWLSEQQLADMLVGNPQRLFGS